MGSYSYFENESISIKDFEGLKQFCERWKKEFPDQSEFADIIKGDEVTFEGWTDWKIISYWYDEMKLFLRCVAKYIDGQVIWRFESDDEGGYVHFINGECMIYWGHMVWNNETTSNLLKDVKDEKIKQFNMVENI
jgi:hypothetical protein